MNFWFFKQLYYILKRITKHKLLLLFILLFISVFFIKNVSYGAFNISNITINGTTYPFSVPLTIDNDNQSYIISYSTDTSQVFVTVPYNSTDFLVSSIDSSLESGTYNRITGYNPTTNSLTDVIIYTASLDTSTGSYGSWTTSYLTKSHIGAPGSTYAQYLTKNIGLYCSGYIVGKNVISSGISLPNNIKLTDNICIFGDNSGLYLGYSSSSGNRFSCGGTIWCNTASGSNAYVDYYQYDTSLGEFVLKSSSTYLFGKFGTNHFKPYYSRYDVGGADGKTCASYDYFLFYEDIEEDYIFPYISNTDDNLAHIDNEDKLVIFPGSLSKHFLPIRLDIIDKTNDKLIYQLNLDTSSPFYLYILENPSDYWFEIPTSEFKNSLINNYIYLFNIYGHNDFNEFTITREIVYQGTTYTPPTEGELITNAINDHTNAIKDQTNAINDQTNAITDSSVEDSSIFLPSDNTNDITADGLNGIFTSIYNAFCSGEAKDIVFPVPYTNTNITLKANYVREMLSNSGASWVITIIEAFWWYIISRFIIKDITNKITKIKSGNIENIEETNIKGDML